MRAVFLPPSVAMPVLSVSISVNSRSTSSTRFTRSSVYSRLEPTGVVRRTLVNPSSLSGIISVPTRPAIGMLARKLAVAIASVVLRCASAQRSSAS